MVVSDKSQLWSGRSYRVKERALRDVEQQLQAVLAMSQDGILMTRGNSWMISYANRRMSEILGCSSESMAGSALIDFVHQSEVETVKINMHMLVTGEAFETQSDHILVRKDGTEFNGRIAARAMVRNDGSLLGVMVTINDNTKLQEAEQALNMIENNYWEIFNASNDAVFVFDAYTGAIVEANQSVEKVYGYTREEMFILNVNDLSSGEPPYSLREAVRWIRKAYEVGPQSFEWLGRKKNGELFWAEVSLNSSHIGGEGRVLGVYRDISDRKEIERKLQFLSSHDTLTGLYNRSHFEAEYERIVQQGLYPLTLIIADLDGLKQVNDTYGHEAGDQLIRFASDILSSVFRAEDILSRIGGDEFAVLLPSTNHDKASEMLERVRDAIRFFNFKSFSAQVAMSLGSATALDAAGVSGIFSAADKMMYEDKSNKRRAGVAASGFIPQLPSAVLETTAPTY
jgi:diguanylate cyclase (GGDEF)-like protein/PAS domain S-box-containing protein